jgi:hypothetical protein
MFLHCFVSGLGGLLMTNSIHSKDVAVFRSRQSLDVLFGALVDASGWVELYGTTDQSIDLDRLICTSRISILEASTPNLLIVQDPLVSLLRAPIGSVWETDVDSFKFLQAARYVFGVVEFCGSPLKHRHFSFVMFLCCFVSGLGGLLMTNCKMFYSNWSIPVFLCTS